MIAATVKALPAPLIINEIENEKRLLKIKFETALIFTIAY